MNVYLVRMDGDHRMILAPTFQSAADESYRTFREEHGLPDDESTKQEWAQTVDQITLSGEVENWPPHDELVVV